MEERADYGIDEVDMKFEKEGENWLEVDESYTGTSKNPINPTLASFKREYSRNERLTYECFVQATYLINKYIDMVNSNPHYANMEIIYLVNSILDRYKNWFVAMRPNVLLGKDKMLEVQKMIDKYYRSDYDIGEMKKKMEEQHLGSMYQATCILEGKDKIIKLSPALKINPGEKIIYKKDE